MPIAYLMLIRKRLKIRKKWIKVRKAYRQDLKIKKKIIKKSFFVTEIWLKNDAFYAILGDLSFIPHKKNN